MVQREDDSNNRGNANERGAGGRRCGSPNRALVKPATTDAAMSSSLSHARRRAQGNMTGPCFVHTQDLEDTIRDTTQRIPGNAAL
eukprot:9915228-Lingulodinium_polyedra.AAC.1